MHTDGSTAILVALLIVVIAAFAYMSCRRSHAPWMYGGAAPSYMSYMDNKSTLSGDSAVHHPAAMGMKQQADASSESAVSAAADLGVIVPASKSGFTGASKTAFRGQTPEALGYEKDYDAEIAAWNSTDVGIMYKGQYEGCDSQHQDTQPPIDYVAMITGQVADRRTVENQLKWGAEMAPWAGTATIVGDSFEPMNYVTRSGLGSFNVMAVKQDDDRLLVTEFSDKNDGFYNTNTFQFNGCQM